MKTYYVRFGSGDPRSNFGLSPTFLIFNTYGSAVTPPGITSVIGATGFYAFQYGTTTPIVFLIDGATTGLDATSRYVSGAIDPVDRMDEIGTTLVAIGTTNFALGTTAVALGITNAGFGLTSVALGTTAVALGVTNVAIGTTNLGYGVTNVAIGTTLTGYGVSTYAVGLSTYTIATSLYAASSTNTAIGLSLFALIGDTSSSFGTDIADPTTVFGLLKRLQEFNEGDQTFTKTTGAWAISSRGGSLLATKTIGNSSSQVTRD